MRGKTDRGVYFTRVGVGWLHPSTEGPQKGQGAGNEGPQGSESAADAFQYLIWFIRTSVDQLTTTPDWSWSRHSQDGWAVGSM